MNVKRKKTRKNPKPYPSNSLAGPPEGETLSQADLGDLRTKMSSRGYILGPKVGEGGFGKVYKIHKKDDPVPRAVKVMKFPEAQERLDEDMEREIKALLSVNHPHIIRPLDIIRTTNRLYLVMTLCDKGTLRSIVDAVPGGVGLSEDVSRPYMTQCAYALEYMHIKLISHRDFKLDNVLVDKDDTIKLTDFGYSRILAKDPATGRIQRVPSIVGTPSHFPPEILRKDLKNDFDATYDAMKSDVWSFAIGMWYCVTGVYPFDRHHRKEMYKNQLELEWSSVNADKMSEEAKKVFVSALQPNPDQRLDISSLIKDHVWFTPPGVDWVDHLRTISQETREKMRSRINSLTSLPR